MQLLGLRSVIYPTKDITQDKVWWEDVLGLEPYFDTEFYVGFNVGGYELGIDPEANLDDGPITYFGVDNVELAIDHFLGLDCELYQDMREVGQGIITAVVQKLYDDQLVGLIYNPNFKSATTVT
jgi:catechol 2,3-dioxygenase-like lactoylglutathione lyase family enzyme